MGPVNTPLTGDNHKRLPLDYRPTLIFPLRPHRNRGLANVHGYITHSIQASRPGESGQVGSLVLLHASVSPSHVDCQIVKEAHPSKSVYINKRADCVDGVLS